MRNVNITQTKNKRLSEFDTIMPLRRPKIAMRRADMHDLHTTLEFAKGELPDGIAGGSVIQTILTHNRNNILLFERDQKVVGFWAMLMVTPLGIERLLLGEFNYLQPELNCLARTGEQPAAIYNWAVVAPRLAAEGVYHVSQFLRKPLYRSANLYSRPNTPSGVQFNLRLGARPIESGTDGLYRYVRLANRQPAFAQAA